MVGSARATSSFIAGRHTGDERGFIQKFIEGIPNTYVVKSSVAFGYQKEGVQIYMDPTRISVLVIDPILGWHDIPESVQSAASLILSVEARGTGFATTAIRNKRGGHGYIALVQ